LEALKTDSSVNANPIVVSIEREFLSIYTFAGVHHGIQGLPDIADAKALQRLTELFEGFFAA
jgi:hypothetical protein